MRREPIDVELIAAEFAEVASARPEHDIVAALEAEVERMKSARAERTELEAPAALETEATLAVEEPPVVDTEATLVLEVEEPPVLEVDAPPVLEAPPFETTPVVQPAILIPLGPVTPDVEPHGPEPEPVPAPVAPVAPVAPAIPEGAAARPPVGLPLDQVRAWLEQVKDDLQKVQARLEFLEFEHNRLEDQQQLVAGLMGSSEPR